METPKLCIDVSDIVDCMREKTRGIPSTNHNVVVAEMQKKLQDMFDELSEWKLELNTVNTNVVVFGSSTDQ